LKKYRRLFASSAVWFKNKSGRLIFKGVSGKPGGRKPGEGDGRSKPPKEAMDAGRERMRRHALKIEK
jgi:hypothetical protein